MDTLITGGLDTSLIFSGPVSKDFYRMKQDRLEMTPQYSPISLSPQRR